MKKLKYISLIVVLSCIFLFAGCANIEYQRLVDDFGQILDKITVEIDSTKLPSEKVNTVVDMVKGDLIEYYVEPMEYRLRLFQYEHPTEYHELIELIKLKGPNVSLEDGIYKISVEVIFPSSDVMAYMYGYDTSNSSNDDNGFTETKNMFIKKYSQTTDNVFGDITQIEFSGENLYQNYVEYVGEEYDAGDITLTQIYGSSDDRMRTNATETIDYNGYSCHLWEFSGDDTSGKLVFYYLTANPTGWYILAICLTVVAVTIIVGCYYFKKRKNKYKSKIKVVGVDDDSEE